jgi:hypothetical protein
MTIYVVKIFKIPVHQLLRDRGLDGGWLLHGGGMAWHGARSPMLHPAYDGFKLLSKCLPAE